MMRSSGIFRSLFTLSFVFFLVGCQPDEPGEPQPLPPDESEEPVELRQVEDRPVEQVVDEAECLLSMGWDPWEPYHYLGNQGEVQGLDIEIISAITDEIGCDLEFVTGNWAGHLRQIQHGSLDVLGGATRTDEREAFARFSEPYRTENFALYIRPGESDRYTGDSLSELLEDGFRLGLTQGFVYGEEVTQLQERGRFDEQIIEAPMGELHFTRLQDHRLDGFLEDPYVVASIQRRRGWQDEVEAHPMTFDSGEVHFMFSREGVDESLVDRFNEALENLRETGQYDEIMNRYRMD